MDPQKTLLAQVEAFIVAEHMTATMFGVRAVNDGKLVFRLRAGTNMTVRTMRRAQEFMATYRRSGGGSSEAVECMPARAA